MQQPFVSVIIPNYCHARYLDERIQSVLGQTYQNFELIILDDCSPDGGKSREVIERYRTDPHVSHIVYNDINTGSPFQQWHKGFSLAKGEYVWIAESDDKAEPQLLQSLVEQMQTLPNASVAFCGSLAFNEDGIIGQVGYHLPPPSNCKQTLSGKTFIHDLMRSGTGIINASCAIVRKAALYKIEGHYTSFRGSGDRMFWVEMAEQGDVVFVNHDYNLFRRHKANSTKVFSSCGINQREDKRILEYIFEKHHIATTEYKECRHNYIKAHIFEGIADKELRKSLYKYWNVSRMEQIMFRWEAWRNRLTRKQ